MGHPHPPVVDVGAPIYTWRGASGPRYFGKGMRIDYHLVSGRLLAQGLVQSSVINGHGTDLRGFMVRASALLQLVLFDSIVDIMMLCSKQEHIVNLAALFALYGWLSG